eukprot:TRINITY_DN1894_c0_g1_i13.p3 TRINITY_DN1894_c0_g1~~TRINITY_DN1894_c0_g1_i13.p3  ORF type:complete len:333 (-),score=39.01 TRINITY_DN1894_c0_g1_i13:136-1134(-)
MVDFLNFHQELLFFTLLAKISINKAFIVKYFMSEFFVHQAIVNILLGVSGQIVLVVQAFYFLNIQIIQRVKFNGLVKAKIKAKFKVEIAEFIANIIDEQASIFHMMNQDLIIFPLENIFQTKAILLFIDEIKAILLFVNDIWADAIVHAQMMVNEIKQAILLFINMVEARAIVHTQMMFNEIKQAILLFINMVEARAMIHRSVITQILGFFALEIIMVVVIALADVKVLSVFITIMETLGELVAMQILFLTVLLLFQSRDKCFKPQEQIMVAINKQFAKEVQAIMQIIATDKAIARAFAIGSNLEEGLELDIVKDRKFNLIQLANSDVFALV